MRLISAAFDGATFMKNVWPFIYRDCSDFANLGQPLFTVSSLFIRYPLTERYTVTAAHFIFYFRRMLSQANVIVKRDKFVHENAGVPQWRLAGGKTGEGQKGANWHRKQLVLSDRITLIETILLLKIINS